MVKKNKIKYHTKQIGKNIQRKFGKKPRFGPKGLIVSPYA